MKNELSTFSAVSIEAVRDFWNERPCNIRHSSKPLATREYFDEVEARKYFVEPHIPTFAEFERWSGANVLEVGCGIGTDTINFARHGARVTAVDLSEASLALARQRAEIYGLQDRIEFHRANVEELGRSIPVQPYDLIYSFGVIHHTPHPSRAIEEISRFARSGTALKFMVYHRTSWKVGQILARESRGRFWRAPEIVARHSEAQTGCPITFTYTRRGARTLLQDSGFRIRSMQVAHIFPYRVPDYVQYRYVKTLLFRHLPTPIFRWLERQIGWHLCITAEH